MFKTKFSPCEITKKAKTWFTDIIDIVSGKSFVLTPNGLGLIKGVQSIFSSRNFLKRIETGLVLFYFQYCMYGFVARHKQISIEVYCHLIWDKFSSKNKSWTK